MSRSTSHPTAAAGRAYRMLIAGSTAVLALALWVCAPAFGARGHVLLRAFPNLEEAGHLNMSLAAKSVGLGPVSGVAVDDETHDVFVADTGNRRVDEFSAAGAFLRAWGWGVENGARELQVCTTAASCQAGLSGSEPGELAQPVAVAVDNDPSSASFHDVYVGDSEDNLVTKFDAEGHLIASWGNNGENASHERVEPNGQLNGETAPVKERFDAGLMESPIAGVAVDSSGNLWVLGHDQHLFKFTQSGAFTVQCTVTNLGGVATKGLSVGPSGAYVADGSVHVRRVQEGKCSEPALVSTERHPTSGFAFDPATNDLYVDSEGDFVEDYSSPCVLSGSSCEPGGIFGEGSLREAVGVAVDQQSGAVYVANAGTEQVLGFDVALEVESAPASGVTAHEATLHGTIDPVGADVTRCEFEYGETEAYGSVVPCEGGPASIGKGNAPVQVQAKLSGLAGGTTYHFRLRGANEKVSVRGGDEQLATSPTAKIVEVAASEVTSTAVALKAVVNPEGVAGTEYHFEYGECPSLAACPSTPYATSLPAAPLATSSSESTLVERVEGLAPGRTYHFRVVVTDVNGSATPSPEGTFVLSPQSPSCRVPRPQPSSEALPDCRGYELVTPADKNGALVNSGAFMTAPQIASDGSRVVAKSIQCFAEPTACVAARQSEGTPYSFERTAAGWLTRPLALPPTFSGSTPLRYNADNGLVLFSAPPSEGQPELFYLRQQDGSIQPMGPVRERAGLAVEGALVSSVFVTTRDYSHLAYNGERLWAFDKESAHSIYMYPGVEGHAILANVTGESRGSTELIGICGASLGDKMRNSRAFFNTLASDGRSVIFTVNDCSTGTGANVGVPVPAKTIYERIERTNGKMKTVEVSGSGPATVCDKECQEAPPGGDAGYEGASASESRVYFTSTRRLTNDASEDPRSGDSAADGCTFTSSYTTGCNLYLWECPNHCEDEASRRLVDVSAGDTSGLGPQVQGVVAISQDGSSVYFVARGVLSGANGEGAVPSPGGDNLYAYGPDSHGTERVAFVGTLAPSDEIEWLNGIGHANVTPDGRYLVFTSHRALTSDVSRPEGPAQVYRYDAQTEQLMRVSIGQEGFNDNGNAGVTGANARAARADLSWSLDGRTDPTMSDDGQFVFFESPVGLTPGALNDVPVTGNSKVLAENIYEWEAFGAKPSENAPACAQPGGCVSLISDGRDVNEGNGHHKNESAVYLLGTDDSGHNVFFETADQLVAQDTDTQVDFYDARVDGGFPAPTPAAVCDAGEALAGEACSHAGSSPGVFGAPASLGFSGPANVPSEVKPLGGKSTPRGLIRAQKLKRALAACRHKYKGRKRRRARIVCERRARRQYRPVKKGRR